MGLSSGRDKGLTLSTVDGSLQVMDGGLAVFVARESRLEKGSKQKEEKGSRADSR